ncbi:MAG: transglycosylase SLT domain-containing protein [Mariprofundus sp.]
MTDWFTNPAPEHEPPVAVIAATPDPFLDDLTAHEIQSLKTEAFRIYGSSWDKIAARSRYVRQPLLRVLNQRRAPLQLQMIPVVESSYNPYAESEVGATGLWQIMPDTADDLHIKSNAQLDGRRDITSSTRGAARFLLKQYERFGSWPLAFAAYHLGPNGVQRRLQRHPWRSGDGLNKLPLPPITKTYIRHILGLIALQKGGQLAFPEPYATSIVLIRSPVDLERLHSTAGLPKNQIFRFNPKLTRMQYFHNRPEHIAIHIPQSRLARVQALLPNKVSDRLNIHLLRGEAARDISKRYHVSIHVLKKDNPMLAKANKRGMHLTIPATSLHRANIAANPLL